MPVKLPTNKIPAIGGHYGGKAKLATTIASCLATHHSFISPFCGFASVELAKSWAVKETLGDINPGTIELLKEIRDRPEKLIQQLQQFQWGPEAFAWCQKETSALATIAYSAMAMQRGGSRSGFSAQQSARAVKRDWSYLRQVSHRLQGIQILCQPWQETLRGAGEGTLVYLDPPYLSGGEHYQYTMPLIEHHDLLRWCLLTRAKVCLSGYADPLYDSHLSSWRRVVLPAKNNHREAREEILWMNY